MSDYQETIKHSDLVDGSFYKYSFRYNITTGYKTGIAVIRWSKGGSFPWLGLHSNSYIPNNTPKMASNSDIVHASYDEISWLKACINSNKFISKENALKLNDMEFKVGDEVKLSEKGNSNWNYQAPNGMVGTILRFDSERWGGYDDGKYDDDIYAVQVQWDDGSSNGYPESALTLLQHKNFNSEEKESLLPEPKITDVIEKSDYFKEEEDLSLEQLISIIKK